MRTLGNIIWHFPFLGFLNALSNFIIGLLFTISLIGAPIGLGMMQYSKFLMAPFTRAMVSKSDLNMEQNKAWQAFSFVIWILYLPFGLALCFVTIFQIVGLFVSVVGIPVAIVLAKSLGTYFNPVNKICVAVEVRDDIYIRNAQQRFDEAAG